MDYFGGNTANGEEEDDHNRRKTSADEVSSSGLEAEHGEIVENSPVEVGDSDADLFSTCEYLERGVLQWLRALDLQAVGACRVDERLKPLFKMNISSGIAEDRLVARLSQHFEAMEIGTLARCLCIPLVSIRVGKVHKEGTLLCPTATKGYLQLTLLPTSDMRLSFRGDNGVKENLAVVNSYRAGTSHVDVEEISADGSGRTFLLGLPDERLLYFWCSERSRLLGSELLNKMKDLLGRRPSLSQLTGISQQRLDSFAAHLRAYLPRLPLSIEAYDDIAPRPSYETLFPGDEGDNSGATVQVSQPPDCSSSSSRPLHPLDPPLYHHFLGLIPSSLSLPLGNTVPSPAVFSPHYCWCPPRATPVPRTLPEPLLLPPLLPELPEGGPRSLDLPLPLIFPPLPPAFSSQQPGMSQQIPTFMSDPIVHVPVIDVCSSGQGYLVSAGPSIPSTVPGPLLPLPDSESPAEKSARETLRMLMASAPSAPPQLRDAFPAVLTTVGDAYPCLHGLNHPGVLVVGSGGLYSGSKDVMGNPPANSSDDDAAEDIPTDSPDA